MKTKSVLKKRLAWFSPMSLSGAESDCLSAWASARLLPELGKRFDVTVFHDRFESIDGYPSAHFLKAAEFHERHPFDFFFYQLEDHPRLNFLRQFAGILPGAVWLHDFLFTSHGPEPILNSPYEDTLTMFGSGEYRFRERGFEYPERERSGIREVSLSVLSFFSREIAHSEAKRRVSCRIPLQVEQDCKFPRSLYLPLPIGECRIARPSEKTRILFCGKTRVEFHPHKVLQAVSALRRSDIDFIWLIDREERKLAAELLREFELPNATLIEGRTPEQWERIVSVHGIALHPLFSVYGQIQPYHSLSMAAGLPTIVTDFGGSEFLPDNLVLKIDPGVSEARQMEEVMTALLSGTVKYSSEAIASYAQDSFSSVRIADEIGFALLHSEPLFQETYRRWQSLEKAARSELIDFSLGVNFGRAERDVFHESDLATRKLREIYDGLGWICPA